MDFDGTLFRLPVDVDALRAELGMEPGERLGDALQRYLDEGDTARLDTVTRHECAAVAEGEFLPGAADLLAGLRGTPAGIVTRNSRDAVLVALGKLADDLAGGPVGDLASDLASDLAGGLAVVGREDVRRLKPDPEGVLAVLAGYGARPEQAVLVGDTFHDVQAARAAGVRSVVVRNPLLAYAPQGADHYIESLAELGGLLAGAAGSTT